MILGDFYHGRLPTLAVQILTVQILAVQILTVQILAVQILTVQILTVQILTGNHVRRMHASHGCHRHASNIAKHIRFHASRTSHL
jgi:hypothetical protein